MFKNCLKNFRLLFSAVISEHFSKNRMIISVVAAKIWYLKNVRFLLGHPVLSRWPLSSAGQIFPDFSLTFPGISHEGINID